MSLEDVFSEENMVAYSKVCMDLAVSMPEVQKKSDFDTILVPSRGAVPIFLGMVYALEKISSIGGEQKEFYENLGIQKLISPLLPENSSAARSNEGKSIRSLFLPFTADLNLSKFKPNSDEDFYTLNTRQYWANVTKSFFKSPDVRAKDPYFKSFADGILRDIESRGKVAEMYESFRNIEKFSLIDTVISGRASTNILKAFDTISEQENNPNMVPEAFLVVTEDGKKLQHPFLPYLKKKERNGEVKMYYTPKIVSEDQGAALLGVASVVYPSVMKESHERLRLENGQSLFFGAGSWRLASDLGALSKKYSDTFEKFMDVIYKGIDHIYSKEYVGNEGRSLEEFNEEREGFIDHTYTKRPLQGENVSMSFLNLNPSYKTGSIYETSSHVVHVPFDEESTHRLISKLGNKLPGVHCVDQEIKHEMKYETKKSA